ncbi:MAG: glutaredoxin family protein [Armatimonadetes bacterium]|nr:glutaredoxin family protein [Armatimonadota bacterium]
MEIKAKIYSSSACFACEKTKSFFKDQGVPYEELNVEENQQAKIDLFKISGQNGLPVIIYQDQVIVGYRPKTLENLIKDKNLGT